MKCYKNDIKIIGLNYANGDVSTIVIMFASILHGNRMKRGMGGSQ